VDPSQVPAPGYGSHQQAVPIGRRLEMIAKDGSQLYGRRGSGDSGRGVSGGEWLGDQPDQPRVGEDTAGILHSMQLRSSEALVGAISWMALSRGGDLGPDDFAGALRTLGHWGLYTRDADRAALLHMLLDPGQLSRPPMLWTAHETHASGVDKDGSDNSIGGEGEGGQGDDDENEDGPGHGRSNVSRRGTRSMMQRIPTGAGSHNRTLHSNGSGSAESRGRSRGTGRQRRRASFLGDGNAVSMGVGGTPGGSGAGGAKRRSIAV